ncbi:hypothetical protein LOTGIDRAFT_118856 [Lottia gigantea]|uniref:Uncharacterized protein n=1 Tax=Lottia gigantea TaxID=225164 RepID=V4AKN0_LOTGI|nr:hypothetical protein LOTGIDRAFT_118856 [Lottia gigantea]ESO94121.1 hypothetical protein LOTGIDRAFT_118856 [Lottia gigantea]
MVLEISKKRLKCVVVGDDWVGKTSMLMGYATNRYPTQHVPAVFDNYTGCVKVAGRKIDLEIMDSIQQESCAELCHNTFNDTDVFVVCFSVVQPDSLENVQKHWIPHIKNMAPETPFVLVGTQADLRQADFLLTELHQQGKEFISQSDADEMARNLGATCYVECSPGVEKQVRQILNRALATVIQETMTSKQCVIL